MGNTLISFLKTLRAFLKLAPMIVFFSIITYLLVTDFQNSVDEYFIRIILKSCLMLIIASAVSQLCSLVILLVWKTAALNSRLHFLKDFFDFICAFPLVEVGIFSIGIFFTGPFFLDWVFILSGLMVISALKYWVDFSLGPIRQLFAFSRFHQVDLRKTTRVLGPFYFSAIVDFFFIQLKQYLLPLVFILVVMDFRIILPRLVEAGLTYQAFVLFLSLIISLHLLSYKKGTAQ